MATKLNPGEFDCYAAAEPDEPLFVLLGRDRHAPILVWIWAKLREAEGEDPHKVQEALSCASQMSVYASRLGKEPVATNAVYEILSDHKKKLGVT